MSLLKYHPGRFQSTRESYRSLLNFFPKTGAKQLTTTCFEKLLNAYKHKLDDLTITLERNKKPGQGEITHELNLICHWGFYYSLGRNIFDIAPNLVEKFKHTDVDRVPLSRIKLPLTNFYLYFGVVNALDLTGNGDFCDGAYINMEESTGSLEIVLTTFNPQNNYNEPFKFQYPDKYLTVKLKFDDSTLVKDALAEFIRTELDSVPQIQDAPRKIQGNFYVDEVEIDGQTYTIKMPIKSDTQVKAEEKKKLLPIGIEALKIVINSLCFIGAMPEEIDRDYNKPLSEELLAMSKLQRPKQKQRFYQKLSEQQYVLINFCGRRIGEMVEKVDEVDEVADKQINRSANYKLVLITRRGHWRLQKHGTKLSLEKLIWIEPFKARAKVLNNQEDKTRIYRVDPN